MDLMLSYRIFRETVPDMPGLGRAQPQLTVPQQEPQEVQPLRHLHRVTIS